jgi:hypothetical protein
MGSNPVPEQTNVSHISCWSLGEGNQGDAGGTACVWVRVLKAAFAWTLVPPGLRFVFLISIQCESAATYEQEVC